MSTDIAFSLGVLALLGTRAPLSLKVFLTAFAIVDDIGAITVIAIFFTETINWVNLGVGVGLLFLLVALNVSGVRNTLVYFLVSVVIWVSFFESGIHATVSGVLIAMTIPMRVRIDPEQFVARGRTLMDLFEREGSGGARRGTYALELEDASKEVESPLQRLEHVLHPWVAFAIMPVFALSNAGVSLGEGAAGALASPVTVGIIVGLVIGKPIGIILFAWIAVKTGIASLPRDISWVQIAGAALLGGVGFTMAIFVTGLAFTDEALVLQSKLAILIASLAAGALGYLLIRYSRDIESRLE
ncbi:Na(+)/H(+) antiporter NhaA [Geodia barretti]|uniref:Na(+)/H(+) antiporter NhaA n=1 Tax=Geodia barretti TaxID=519541 RepID=A0AA35X1S9_GEOBA|nr:Na(+)/H(+) antiporter NhaA [Geodia barretti]